METAHLASLCFMGGGQLILPFTERETVSDGEAEMGFRIVQMYDGS